MAPARDRYRIVRIRLVNFHNLGTVTVDLPGGGHLFLLGDNGSGKTTLLDAIHYVLAPGRLEFNAAARVAGPKDADGRKVQGIVLRYNVETGAMRERGISYAALELATLDASGDPGEKRVSLCVGISAEGMNVAYDSWGAVADTPVDSLQLEVAEGCHEHVARRDELRKSVEGLPGGHFYGKIGQYVEAIAERFFSGRATYENVCKLLSTGKAYREIAAKAGNLDALFRRLLEDPDREVFSNLVEGLRSIEQSKADLDAITESVDWLASLRSLRKCLLDARLDEACAAWAVDNLQARECDARADAERAKAESAAIDRQKAEADAAEAAREADRHRSRIAELRAKDSSGLLRREKELASEESRARAGATAAAERLVVETRESVRLETECGKLETLLRDELRRGVETVVKAGRKQSWTLAPLGEKLDAASRAERVVDAVFALDASAEEVPLRTEERRLHESLASLRGGLERAVKERDEAKLRLEEIRAQGDPVPNVEGFEAAAKAIRDAVPGLSAEPLYRLLVPRSERKGTELSAFEQVLGDELLATWVVEAADTDALRKLLFHDHRRQSIAVRSEIEQIHPADWLGRWLDLDKTDPDAALLVQHALAAKAGPNVSTFLEERIVAFRCRQSPVFRHKPRLIDEKSRKEEHARLVREAEEAVRTAEHRIDLLSDERETQEAALDAVQDAIATVSSLFGSLVRDARKLEGSRRDADEAARRKTTAEADDLRAKDEIRRFSEQLGDIRLRMRKEGVGPDLERRIRETERACKSCDDAAKEADRRIGACGERHDASVRAATAATEAAARHRANRDVAQAQLAPSVPSGEDISSFVRARLGADEVSLPALHDRTGRIREEKVRAAERIRNRLVEPRNSAFGFVFEERDASLRDRRGEAIEDVWIKRSQDLEDQQGVITAKTREVFRHLFVGDVLQRLWEDNDRLKSLVNRVGRKLDGRPFGSNYYSFGIKPNPEYQDLLQIVSRFSSFDAGENADEIRAFLERHHDKILNAPVGEIPELFDYRNWYEFQLRVKTVKSEQTLSRDVKALGSGGEQAVPNYLLVLTVANFLYTPRAGAELRLQPLIFDEAFYGIDAARRDQLLSFADELGLQLFIASPDQDGVKKELACTTSLFVVKDAKYDVHLYHYDQNNRRKQGELFDG